jgi:hypothetical protein
LIIVLAMFALAIEQMTRADLYRDLPRGRKRRGWKREFLESLTEAAEEIGGVSDEKS